MRRIIYIILVASICISCTSTTDDSIESISIDVTTNSSLTDFIANEHTIQLETNDDCLISNINKLCIDPEYLYIMDNTNQKIFIFDYNGEFISKIDSHGNGPGEYIDLTDISVCNKHVYVLSRANKSIYVYSNDGTYKKKIDLNDWYHRLNVTNDYIMLYSCKSNQQFYDIVTIDHKGNVVRKDFPFAKNESFVFNINPFNTFSNEEYLLSFPYERRVALLNSIGCDYKYKFNFNTEVNFTDKEMDELGYEEIRNRSLYKEALKQIDCITKIDDETFLMIVTIFLKERGLRKVLVKTDISKQFSKIFVLGDVNDKDFPLFYDPICINGDKIYCITSNTDNSKNSEELNPCIGIYLINKN